MHKKIKIPFNIALAVIITICAIYASVPKMQDNKVIKVAEVSRVYCVENTCTLFEPFASNNDYNATKNYLEKNNLYDIDNMFIIEYNFVNAHKMEYFTGEFKVRNLYITKNAYDEMKYYLDNYFKNTNILFLEDSKQKQTEKYIFTYIKVTNSSGMVTIQYNNDEYQLFSKKSYI